MLLGEQRGGHEDGHLLAVLDRFEHGPERDLGLAEADVADHEPVHGRLALHVGLDVVDGPQLVGRRLVREGGLELGLPGGVAGVAVATGCEPLLVEDDQLLGDLVDRRADLGLGPGPRVPAESGEGRRLAAGVVADGVDLVGRHVQLVAALVLQQEVVALDAPDGPLHHAAVAGHAVLVVDDVVTRLQVVEELLRIATAGTSRAVTAPPAGEVGLGQQRQPHAGQDAPPLEGGDDHLALDPGIVEQLAQPGRRSLAVSRHHDPVAVGLELPELAPAALLVAQGDLEGERLHRGHLRALGRGGDLPGRGLGAGQDPLQRQVQRREVVLRAVAVASHASAPCGVGRWRVVPDTGARAHPPGPGQAVGQVGLLGQELLGPVSQAAGLDQQDLAVGREDVTEETLVGGQPREPRLHAVEELALGDPLPVLTTPRFEGDQLGRPGPDVVGGQQLPAREDLDVGDVVRRALVGHRELGQAVDLVAPQVDADRPLGGGREHVDDRTPHRDLAPVLDLVLAPIAEADERSHQAVEIDGGPDRHHERVRPTRCPARGAG